MKLNDPYWTTDEADIPFRDFCREIVPPGTNETFPAGAVGVRMDDDFWQAAALPWEWRDRSIQEIVAALWPGIAADSRTRYEPDSGGSQRSGGSDG